MTATPFFTATEAFPAIRRAFEAIAYDAGLTRDVPMVVEQAPGEPLVHSFEEIEAVLAELSEEEAEDFAIGDGTNAGMLVEGDTRYSDACGLLNAYFEEIGG